MPQNWNTFLLAAYQAFGISISWASCLLIETEERHAIEATPAVLASLQIVHFLKLLMHRNNIKSNNDNNKSFIVIPWNQFNFCILITTFVTPPAKSGFNWVSDLHVATVISKLFDLRWIRNPKLAKTVNHSRDELILLHVICKRRQKWFKIYFG